MQDKELYQQILGLSSPWTVADVQLDHVAQEIRVRVEHPRGATFRCPECDCDCAIHDHAVERRWRHLDSCQFKTLLIAAPPRVKCPTHGVKNASLPWAEKGSRFTMLFERFAIDVLRAARKPSKVLKESCEPVGTRLGTSLKRPSPGARPVRRRMSCRESASMRRRFAKAMTTSR